jgi:hypothetical protein
MAYTYLRGEEWFVNVDGKEGKPYDGIVMKILTFSPDSQKVAYAAKTGKQWVVVVDGKENKQYDDIVRKGGGEAYSF